MQSLAPYVAALFVDPTGPYAGRDDVDPWDEERDARKYAGPYPVVAHPPCERWGKFWHRGKGGKRAALGNDGGCFRAALKAVEQWGGVLEHPEGSLAWRCLDLPRPTRLNQWLRGGSRGLGVGWACLVDQGRYGHRAQKRSLLYYVGLDWPHGVDLRPSTSPVLTSPNTARVGVELMGRRERRITPPAFADALIRLARYAATGDEDF